MVAGASASIGRAYRLTIDFAAVMPTVLDAMSPEHPRAIDDARLQTLVALRNSNTIVGVYGCCSSSPSAVTSTQTGWRSSSAFAASSSSASTPGTIRSASASRGAATARRRAACRRRERVIADFDVLDWANAVRAKPAKGKHATVDTAEDFILGFPYAAHAVTILDYDGTP
jgi:hypothetical protein